MVETWIVAAEGVLIPFPSMKPPSFDGGNSGLCQENRGREVSLNEATIFRWWKPRTSERLGMRAHDALNEATIFRWWKHRTKIVTRLLRT